MTARPARVWHALTAAVCLLALVIQMVLVVDGESVLVTEDPPGLALRVLRYFAYFTIQSNILVAFTTALLALDPVRDGRWFRVGRLAALVGITVTGLVHFFLLRPLLDLQGWSYVTDKMLHVVVPLMAVVGWLAGGPRPRITRREVGLFLIWPILWLAATMLQGSASNWYPYPFLNPAREGGGVVVVACVGITVLFLALAGLYLLGDRRLPPAPGDRPPAA